MRIRMLQAFQGDAILVTFTDDDGNKKNIFIDSGTPKAYFQSVKPELDGLVAASENVDLWIVTHTDDDHIGGILAWFNGSEGYATHPNLVRHFWINTTGYANRVNQKQSTKVSARQGVDLEKFLLNTNIPWDKELIAPTTHEICGAEFTLLSPSQERLTAFQEHAKTKKAVSSKLSRGQRTNRPLLELMAEPYDPSKQDKSPFNGASIAFLFEAEGKKVLFLGDAWASTVADSLTALGYHSGNPLEVDCVKLAHHGSQRNVSPDLLSLLKCRQFLISTMGSGHPDKETLALIMNHAPADKDVTFTFNYDNSDLRSILTQEDLAQHAIQTRFPARGNHYIDAELE
ncbi:MAG: hypothetical protein QNK37_14305 [Acidobacteriota bacterium]|nr:hypothetical protein [Acidobacteriota bacterium]